MGVTRFEDLVAWQKARVLTRDIYADVRNDALRADPALASQMRRAAVSIMANIAEGFARRGPAEFRRYLDIAFGSCMELESHLYVALDARLITSESFDRLYQQSNEVGRLILALKRSTLRIEPSPHRPATRGAAS